MYTLFVILIVIAAVLMIGIVLIQESKGGGLSSSQDHRFHREGHMGTCCRYGCHQRYLRLGSSHSNSRQLCHGEHREPCHQS